MFGMPNITEADGTIPPHGRTRTLHSEFQRRTPFAVRGSGVLPSIDSLKNTINVRHAEQLRR